jgi:PIN domain nuclease of toxin-antitoxin system
LRLLLDTHTALWAVDTQGLLPPHIVEALTDVRNTVFVSTVTIWEIAIKSALRRHAGKLPVSSGEALFKFREAGFQLLDITPEHALAVEGLPLLHADPFDRLLVAQALSEPIRLVSRDRQIVMYSDTFLTW